MKNKGFTVIELLVVIAIVGILAAVVISALHNGIHPPSCSIYGNSPMKDIPARCINYFNQ